MITNIISQGISVELLKSDETGLALDFLYPTFVVSGYTVFSAPVNWKKWEDKAEIKAVCR